MGALSAHEAGTWQTQIVVWDVDDPAKANDPRYWWSAEEVGHWLRTSSPAGRHHYARAELPKGESLAELRARYGGDEVGIGLGGIPERFLPGAAETPWNTAHIVRFSLASWRDADPEKTRLIVRHSSASTPEAKQAAERSALPSEVEELRLAWIEARKAGDEQLREQLDSELEAAGCYAESKFWAWDPDRAFELAPGVWAQDERPRR